MVGCPTFVYSFQDSKRHSCPLNIEDERIFGGGPSARGGGSKGIALLSGSLMKSSFEQGPALIFVFAYNKRDSHIFNGLGAGASPLP
jgi:hypothetical protein